MEVLQRTANRGSISTGYDIDNSVKLEADNDERFTRTPSSAGNRKTWTFSAWVKRTELGANQILISAADTYLYFGSDDKIYCNFRPATENFFLSTNRLFRDTSAWYHIVVQCDTTDSTAADRAKLYINGVRETSYSDSTYQNMSQNLDTSMNNTIEHMIGRYSSSDDYRMSGYISEFHLVDGTALTPTSFGEYDDDSGIWKPKEVDVTYGTNGFYLDFSDAANLGDDVSGNSNDFTENNITSADQATDVPSNNFAVLNTISATSTVLDATEGATFLSNNDGSISWQTISATIGVTSGKWYWENQKNSNTGNFFSGIAASDDPALRTANLLGATSEGSSIAFQYSNNSIANGSGSFTMVSGEIMMFALDMDNGALYFGKQGTWQNSSDPTSGASKTGASTLWSSFDDKIVLPALQAFQNNQIFTNFGGYSSYAISSPASDANGYGTFEYAPPTGYYALCTKNLAEFG